MKTGFTCGAFDLCHYGHILMFEECKRHCDKLIVGVQTDPSIDRPDKNAPVQSLEERVCQVRALKWVDEVIIYSTEEDLLRILRLLRVDIRFLGADWWGKPFTGHDIPMEFHFCERDHSFSSSELRQRIYISEMQRMKSTIST